MPGKGKPITKGAGRQGASDSAVRSNQGGQGSGNTGKTQQGSQQPTNKDTKK